MEAAFWICILIVHPIRCFDLKCLIYNNRLLQDLEMFFNINNSSNRINPFITIMPNALAEETALFSINRKMVLNRIHDLKL